MSNYKKDNVKTTKKSIGIIIFNKALDKVLLVQKKMYIRIYRLRFR